MTQLTRISFLALGVLSIAVMGEDTFDKMTAGNYIGCAFGSGLIYLAYVWPRVWPNDPLTTREDM